MFQKWENPATGDGRALGYSIALGSAFEDPTITETAPKSLAVAIIAARLHLSLPLSAVVSELSGLGGSA